ncbi:hypothetical protein D3C84_748130 [compost metagenome]
MLVDIYRDQTHEKYLIVKCSKDITKITAADAEFLKDLKHWRRIDTDFENLPTGLHTNEVLIAIEGRGYYAARRKVTIREIEILD